MTPQPKMALLIAESQKDAQSYAVSDQWQNFVMNVRQFLPPAGKTERIAESSWLIPLDSELSFFAALVKMLKDFGIPFRILFFEKEPDWIKHPPSA
jgi:hypothetical protein